MFKVAKVIKGVFMASKKAVETIIGSILTTEDSVWITTESSELITSE